ncbi:hypothetical protein BV20DRAFT_714232 [Pilatotrama ljubarskyi]|nr:hypothetical protein BV20DRAFT_714232 [Pilatotrama ljubarskyi]
MAEVPSDAAAALANGSRANDLLTSLSSLARCAARTESGSSDLALRTRRLFWGVLPVHGRPHVRPCLPRSLPRCGQPSLKRPVLTPPSYTSMLQLLLTPLVSGHTALSSRGVSHPVIVSSMRLSSIPIQPKRSRECRVALYGQPCSALLSRTCLSARRCRA